MSAFEVHRIAESTEALLSASAVDVHPWIVSSTITWGLAPYRTWFRAIWNERGLFIRYDVEDAHPWHTLTRRDDPLWEEEVVEIFLDPDRCGHHYAELEINPANVVCDVRMLAPSPNRSMDLAWDIAGLESRTVAWSDDAGALTPGVAAGWAAFARIPFDSLSSLPTAANLPPLPGDRWRFNVFRIKRPGGPLAPDTGAIFAAWSPTGGPSFHVPAAFRDLVFR
jgi:hypothetical protein